jgi:hypothetical protein
MQEISIGSSMSQGIASNYRVARGLFWIAALSFGSLGVVWSAQSHGYSLVTQMIVAGICAAIAAAGLVWGVDEIKGRANAETPPTVDKSSVSKPDLSKNSPNLSKNSPNISAGGNISIGHIGDVITAPTPQQPTATEIAEQVAKLLKTPAAPQLKLELVIDEIRADDAGFRFIATNIGTLEMTVVAWNYYIEGEMSASERPASMIKRELAPSARLALMGLPINGLIKRRNISVEVEYTSNIGGVSSTFNSSYRFAIPAGPVEGRSIDPIEASRTSGAIANVEKKNDILRAFLNPTGTIYLVVPETHPDGTANRTEVSNNGKYFLYDPENRQALFGISYPDGKFQYALGFAREEAKKIHIISMSWDDTKTSLIFRVDGHEYNPKM